MNLPIPALKVENVKTDFNMDETETPASDWENAASGSAEGMQEIITDSHIAAFPGIKYNETISSDRSEK